MNCETIKNYNYLNYDILKGFDNYKYNARDTSPLSLYIMHPFWNFVVKFCPPNVAPNVLTFVGFLFTAANFLILSYYDWNFQSNTNHENTTPIPAWFWILAAVNIFLAYTLDGIDGKQARKIGLSGPLGELFDHGLDSYTAVLIPGCLYSIFGNCSESIPPMRMYMVCWTVFFNFYVSHWEKYITGVLYLPWGYDFSMWGSTAMYLSTWYFGYGFWKINMFGIPLSRVIEALLHVSAMSNIPMVIRNIYKSYKYKTGKMRTFSEAIRPMYPFVMFMFLLILWPIMSPNSICDTDPRILFLLSGTIFSNISCRLIVSQMSNTRCDSYHWMLPVYSATILIALCIPQLERLLLYMLCLATTLSHWHYGTRVVQVMCVHFNRICFSTKPRMENKPKEID
ncbi:EPT1.2 family protein [Megaselia abdita]